MSSTSIHKLSSPFPKFPSTEVNVNATTHLMDNSWSWRNNQHILKGLGTPFKENKPFFVSLKFNFLIFFQCFWPKIKRKKSQKNCENILLKQFCAIFRVLNTLCVFYGTPKKKKIFERMLWMPNLLIQIELRNLNWLTYCASI